jgi:hypothetical protein
MAKDTFDLTSSLVKGVESKENQAKQNDIKLYKTSNIKYSISPLYARYVGKTITIAFNGNFRKLPVDGSEFEISQGHYNALKKYLNHIDRQIKIAQQNANFMGDPVNGDFRRL